tara:strand:- start:73265 stop:73582 length:318 start_codon:yes stop_codon:yes gene_type:complete
MITLGNHRVIFIYKDENILVKRNNGNFRVTRPTTSCIIKPLEGEEILAKATVSLHHQDNPDKCAGREFAFRSAVQQIEYKEDRTAIWTDFRHTVRSSCSCKKEVA